MKVRMEEDELYLMMTFVYDPQFGHEVEIDEQLWRDFTYAQDKFLTLNRRVAKLYREQTR